MLNRRNIPQDIRNRFNALRANTPPEAHLIQFIRNEFPTEPDPQINQIFQILTGQIFQGRVPGVNQNFNFQTRRRQNPSRSRSRSRSRPRNPVNPPNPTMAAAPPPASVSYVTNPYWVTSTLGTRMVPNCT